MQRKFFEYVLRISVKQVHVIGRADVTMEGTSISAYYDEINILIFE